MTYSLDNSPSLFSINQSSGYIIANGTVDREMNTQFILTVIASETQGLVHHNQINNHVCVFRSDVKYHPYYHC